MFEESNDRLTAEVSHRRRKLHHEGACPTVLTVAAPPNHIRRPIRGREHRLGVVEASEPSLKSTSGVQPMQYLALTSRGQVREFARIHRVAKLLSSHLDSGADRLTYEIRECRSCDWTASEPCGIDEPGEPDYILDVLCGDCCETMERRYRRPFHSPGFRTLGDFLLEEHTRVWRVFLEGLDSDILEVFPSSSDGTRPAARRSRSDDRRLPESLGRIGKAVCLTAPANFGWDVEDGPFLIAGFTGNGAQLFLQQADWHCVFEMEPECVNAYLYSLEGRPLGLG